MKSLFSILFYLSFISSFFAQYDISGTVKNEQGEYLVFATVYLEGSNYAAATDEKGRFNLSAVPEGNYTLKVSYVGYKSRILSISIPETQHLDIVLLGSVYNLENIEIRAARVKSDNPFSYVNLDKATLLKENLGVDVPFILQWTPSVVVTSDAGAGIGYTGMRLRGSDQTRINVTINGIPLNDAESQDVFWVDLPDLMGSVQNVQIQRGVGPSTNGAGAFGGTVSINTHRTHVNPYVGIDASMAAFNTQKLSVQLGSGLINDKYSFDARYSAINSDGYVDRASSDLRSWYFSAARLTEKSSLRLNVLSGSEITYQSWNGVPESKIKNDPSALINHYYNNLGSLYKTSEDSVNLFSSDRRYNYYTYPDQVDNYTQTHVQLLHALSVKPDFKINTTLYYTKGQGYFEQFKSLDKFSNYGLQDFVNDNGEVINRTDIVRRRWLDNDLIGVLSDFVYDMHEKHQLQGGLALNKYIGDHFGNVVFNALKLPVDPERRYYDNRGNKKDFSGYIRHSANITQKLKSFADVQLRSVDYSIHGVDNDLREITLDETYLFFNPKAGLYWDINKNNSAYLSYAVGQREPARSDFLDNAFGRIPKPEFLANLEVGYKWQFENIFLNTNVYWMQYRDQLVLSGDLNDVGAPLRINVPDSYRLGIELDFFRKWNSYFSTAINLTLSRNKIKIFDEIIFDYTTGEDRIQISHQSTDIAFSPPVISALQLNFMPLAQMEISLSTKYVAKQFLDNTSNDLRSLDAYFYQNLRVGYTLNGKFFKNIQLSLMVNNLFNSLYSSNGYTYSYVYENLITENFLYPQAGRNWMAGLSILF